MYAVVSTGGKQLKVEKGTEAVVEHLKADVGDSVELEVLFVADDESITVGEGAASAKVTAEVVEHLLGDKVVVFKFKRRKGYKRTKGHRQALTRIRVTEIAAGKPGKRAAAKKAEEPKAAKKAEEPKAEAVAVEEPKLAEPVTEKAPATEDVVKAQETEAGQCEAVKANGERCGNKAKEGSKYCGVHAKKHEG